MKKKLLIVAMLVVLALGLFVISVSAEENVPEVTHSYYLVQSLDSEAALALNAEGKTNLVVYADLIGSTLEKTNNETTKSVFFGDFAEGSHIEIILAEDIFVPKTIVPSNVGILINTAITVTIKYNGFAHYIDNSGSSSSNGIVLRNRQAKIRLIGTKGKDLADGGISDNYKKPSGDIADGNFKCDNSNLDVFKYANEYVTATQGTVYVENVRSCTGTALVKTKSGVGLFEFYDSALYSPNNYAIDIMGNDAKTIIFENGRCQGIEFHSALTGSRFKNVIVTGAGVVMDCWSFTGQVWEFEGCTINKVDTSSGRTHLYFTGCTFDENTLALGSDGGGATYLYVITKATCTEAGSRYYYYGNSEKDNDQIVASKTQDDQYPIDNPALGHGFDADNITNIEYKNGFMSAGLCTSNCVRCNEAGIEEKEASASPLFTGKGFSRPESNGKIGLAASFGIDLVSIEKYELVTGKSVEFGAVAAGYDNLGANTLLDANGDATVLAKGQIIKANVGKKVSTLTIKITGFTSEHMDTKIVMGGYVIATKGEEKEISYFQLGTPAQGDLYSYATYNSVQ